jgi:outer membrane protein, heavy metal efflux system
MSRSRFLFGAAFAVALNAANAEAQDAEPMDPPPVDPVVPVTPSVDSVPASPRTVDLASVLATLDERHPLLQSAAEERRIAEGDVQSADGAFDVTWRSRGSAVALGYYQAGRIDTVVEVPTEWWGLTMFAGYRWGSDTFADYEGKLPTNEYGEVRAGAMIPFWRNGPTDRRRANLWRAEVGTGLAELSVAERQIELARITTIRYWEWVGAGQRLRVSRTVLDVALDRDLQISVRALTGDLPEIERIENARAILQRRQQVVAAERSLAQAAFELSLYYRTSEGQPILLTETELPTGMPDPVPVGEVDREIITEALGRRPEITRLRGIRDQALIEREWAGNQRAPAIDLSVMGSQDLGPGSETRNPFELEVSLFLDIPIERNVADGRVKAAEGQIARAEAQARFATEQISTQVRDATNAVTLAEQRHKLAVAEVDVARQLERAERERFDLGDSSLLIVNLREQTALEAAVREVDALVDYHRSRATLEAATGARANPGRVRAGR